MIALWANQGGGLNAALSFWLPLDDLGAGQVNLVPISSVGSGTATFTRATTAWTKLASGLWAQVASGVARSCYLGADTAVGAYGGFFREDSRTNECLQSRDFTNASWTKSNVTAAKDQAGIDGVAASASSLTSTAANGTVKQAITSASAARRFSVFVKRITGTGNIDLTLDNGATWTTISGSINSATFTRVAIGQTVTNPTVGIRIVASGDKIAVDMAQEEVGTFDTSPIPTTTATVTRNADVLTYPASGNFGGTVGSVAAVAVRSAQSGSDERVVTPVAASQMLIASNGGPAQLYDGTNTAATANAAAAGTVERCSGAWGGSTMSVCLNGGTVASAAFDGDMNIGTSIAIGFDGSFNGMIQNVRAWTRKLSDSELAAL